MRPFEEVPSSVIAVGLIDQIVQIISPNRMRALELARTGEMLHRSIGGAELQNVPCYMLYVDEQL